MISQSLRTQLFKLHAWLGLNIAIILMLLFASGTILVFSTEIEGLVYMDQPESSYGEGQQASVGAVYDSVKAAYPNAGITFIRKKDVFGQSVSAVSVNAAWGERAVVWVSNRTGEVLGQMPDPGFKVILRSFHDGFFAGQPFGRLAATAFGIALLGSIATGVLSYARFWRGFARLPVRKGNSRAKWASLHRFIAVWSIPFLLVMTVTCIYYFVAAMGVLPSEKQENTPPAKRSAVLPAGFAGEHLDKAVAAAKAALPSMQVSVVTVPARRNKPIVVLGPDSEEVMPLGPSVVTVDPETLDVLDVRPVSSQGPNAQLKSFMISLHYGEWGGMATRIAWLVFGVAGTLLILAGAMIFAAKAIRPARGESVSSTSGSSALRRVWRGMFFAKWGLALGIIGIAAFGLYRYGPFDSKWNRVWLKGSETIDAKLWVKGPLRSGETLPLRIQLPATEGGVVSAAFNGEALASFSMQQTGAVQRGIVRPVATADENTLSVTIKSDGQADQSLVWALGPPLKR